MSSRQGDNRLPGVIRTVADVERLVRSPAAVRRLPRSGIPVALPGVDPETRNHFQARLREYIAACGCGAGAAACLTALVALAGYLVLLAPQASWSRLGGIAVAGLVGVLAVTGLAKLIALRVARARFERSGARLIRSLQSS